MSAVQTAGGAGLLERQGELDALRTAMESARAGSGTLVYVEAPAGLVGGNAEREPGLSHSADTAEGKQASRAEKLVNFGDLPNTADEAAQVVGQVALCLCAIAFGQRQLRRQEAFGRWSRSHAVQSRQSITAAWDSYDKAVPLTAFVQRLSEG